MAFEVPGFKYPAHIASGDQSGNQFRWVKITGTAQKVLVATAAGEFCVGVLQNKPLANEEAEIMSHGVTKLVAGETLVAGDRIGTTANGRARKMVDIATGRDVDLWVLGHCLVGAATGEYATVMVGYPCFLITA